jgi:hypothetical protein
LGCILKDNGDVSTEFNIHYDSAIQILTRDSCVSVSGGRGGLNFGSEFTLDSSSITSDPLFTDPDNGTPSLRDFSLQAGSPAKDITYTLLNSSTSITFDMGVAQPALALPTILQGANLRGNHQ